MFFENIDDANRRLARSVVMYKGTPVYIMQITEERVEIYDMLSGMTSRVPLSDEDKFDLTPVNLGYVNLHGHAYYSWRTPARRSKHGLDEGAFIIPGGSTNILTSREMAHTILNIYPNLDKCMLEVNRGNASEMAFHRKFAVYKSKGTIGIRYKGDKIIAHIGTDSLIRMAPNMGYLDSLLMEVVGYERYKII